MTPFQKIYDRFFVYVTDDFFTEVCKRPKQKELYDLLMASMPLFEFPREPFSISTKKKYEEVSYFLDQELTEEEVNILAVGMAEIWSLQQTLNIENTRHKFSGPDFKISSQASHLQRLMKLEESMRHEHRRLQMLHSRRELDPFNQYQSAFYRLATPLKNHNPRRRGVSMLRNNY